MYLCTYKNKTYMKKINPNNRILISNHYYDLSKDNRFLIPFIEGTKIGFANKEGEIIIPSKFQFVLDDFTNEKSLVRVGEDYALAYERKTKCPTTYIYKHFGILKSNGDFLVPMEYNTIIASKDLEKNYVLYSINKGYAVINNKGEFIVPFGVYNYISGFDYFHARIRIDKSINNHRKSYWGIIDYTGKIVLEPKYKFIYNFYNTSQQYVKVISFDNVIHEFHFLDNTLKYNGAYDDEGREFEQELEDYQSLQEYTFYNYNGSYAQDVMGYSDQEIDDAFDGDPDAYWNID